MTYNILLFPDKMASHKKLRGGVCLVDDIPKSPSGKILRREILRATLGPASE